MNLNLRIFHKKHWRRLMINQKNIYVELCRKYSTEAETILELGCGDGEDLKSLQKQSSLSNKNFIGIDLISQKITDFTYIQSDLNGIFPVTTASVNMVMSNQVIEHIYKTDDFLDEITRVLAPGGILVLSTVNLAAYHYRLMLLFGYSPLVLHPSRRLVGSILKNTEYSEPFYGHKSVFTFNGLVELIQKYYGFEIIEKQSFGMSFLPAIVSTILLKLCPNMGTYTYIVAKKI